MVYYGPISTGTTYTTNFSKRMPIAYRTSPLRNEDSKYYPCDPFTSNRFDQRLRILCQRYIQVYSEYLRIISRNTLHAASSSHACSKHSQRRIARLLTLPVNVIMSRLFSRHQSVCRETAL
jgi:hypothetical protein